MPGIALDAPMFAFTGKRLVELYPGRGRKTSVNLQPNTTYAFGTALAIASAGVNDVQTVSISGTPTGGTFTLTINVNGNLVTTAAIAYNASAATVQAAIQAVVGSGNATCSGGALPGSAVVVTFAASFGNQPMPLMTASGAGLTGGTSPAVSVAHTTTGAFPNAYGTYSSALAAVPGAPVVTGTGSGSGWAAGTYEVQVTGVNAQGETTPSVTVGVTLTAAQLIHIAAISGLDTSLSSLNVYVDGDLIGSTTVSAGTSTAANFDIAGVTTKGNPPLVNTAYTSALNKSVAFLEYDCVTDAAGNVTFGQQSGGGDLGQQFLSAPVYLSGDFKTSDLVGFDTKALADMGRLVAGTVTNGVVHIP